MIKLGLRSCWCSCKQQTYCASYLVWMLLMLFVCFDLRVRSNVDFWWFTLVYRLNTQIQLIFRMVLFIAKWPFSPHLHSHIIYFLFLSHQFRKIALSFSYSLVHSITHSLGVWIPIEFTEINRINRITTGLFWLWILHKKKTEYSLHTEISIEFTTIYSALLRNNQL